MTNTTFKIGAEVSLAMSGEKGKIIGKAEYESYPDSFMVRYVAADGRQCEGWFEAPALK
jgi:hypothetical protein